MLVTVEQFQALFPHNQEARQWVAALNAILPKYAITTGLRLAAFLSQCGHESQGFTRTVENLNYGAPGLAATWPNRYAVDPKAKTLIPNDLAKRLARRPEAIANHAYASRLGNGPEESGDGWKYRGRGVIQCTGKACYTDFARYIGRSLDDTVAYLETKEGAVESACWYWATRALNKYADARNTLDLTRRINGGLNGLQDRQARYVQALDVITA